MYKLLHLKRKDNIIAMILSLGIMAFSVFLLSFHWIFYLSLLIAYALFGYYYTYLRLYNKKEKDNGSMGKDV